MYTYQKPSLPYDPNAVVVYVDPQCTVPAAITINGAAVTNSEINVGADGAWPEFQSVSTPVYILDNSNVPVPLSPTVNYASPAVITGSRGSATATVLENLIQGLISIGLPLSDQTTV